MTIDSNRAVVKKFIKELLGSSNIDLIDELLAPDYVNKSMGVTNRNDFKAMISGLKDLPIRHYEIANLIAEGDSVVFRGDMNVTLANGKKVSARVITYDRLVNGKIVEDEPISVPPLTEVMSGMIPPKTSS